MQKQKVRFGILCTAEIATKVCRAIQNSMNSEVVGVASRNLDKANEWAKKHDIPKGYGSYEELIADKSIDVIYIPLPTAFKTEWAVKAANAGKHVLVEKPLPGLKSDEEVLAMINACKANNLQFMDGTMWLHSNRTLHLENLIRQQKKIGKVQRVISSFTFMAENEQWLNGGNGRTDSKREPMGCLGDQGWYPLGAILWAFNYETPIKAQMTWHQLNTVDTIVAGIGTLWFSDNRVASFDFGATQPHRQQFEVIGDTGCIRIEDHVGGQGRSGDFQAYFKNYTGSTDYKIDDLSGKESIEKVDGSNHTVKMIEDFSDMVMKGVNYEWANRSLVMHRVMLAIYKSAMNNNSIEEVASQYINKK